MKLSSLLSAFLLVAYFSVEAHANWSALLSTTGGQPASASHSGVVAAWPDGDDVYAKQFSPTGSTEWTTTLASSGGEGLTPLVVVQGEDYYVAWLQPSAHILKIVRLSGGGTVTATATLDSTVLTNATGLSLVPRSGGGVAVGWVASSVGYVRLYGADLGSTHYSAKFDDDVGVLRLVADDDNGVIAAWSHYATYPESPAVRGNRVTATGTKLWANPTTLIDAQGHSPTAVVAVKDGTGGAVIGAIMGSFRIYAQHVDEDGVTYWDNDYIGTDLCDGTCGLSVNPQVVINSSQTAAIIAWEEYSPIFELKASKLLLNGSGEPQWETVMGSATYPWLRVAPYGDDQFSYQMVAGANDETKFVRSVYDDGAYVCRVDYTVVDDDGNLGPYYQPIYTQSPVYSYGNTVALSPIVDCDLGVYVPNRFYDSGWKVYLFYFSYPITNVVYSFNPTRCRTSVTWNTVAGTTGNKLQYRNLGGSTWTTLNATGSNGSYTQGFLQETAQEFRLQSTISGVEYSTKIYPVYDICEEPDPQGAPVTQNKVMEAFLAAHPNPFNPEVTIDYGLPAASDVVLRIFDISGRQVKTLVTELKPAGRYSTTWRGDNDRGEPVASGVYFGRLTTNGTTISHKLVILK